MKTSLKLSKLLQERGFKEFNEWTWEDNGDELKHILTDEHCDYDGEITTKKGTRPVKDIPAYDIIYDICIKYAKELFGESGYYTGKGAETFTGIKTMREASDRVEEFKDGLFYKCYKETAESIFKMILYTYSSQEEIEDYIIKNLT